jgi:hypothetical protein
LAAAAAIAARATIACLVYGSTNAARNISNACTDIKTGIGVRTIPTGAAFAAAAACSIATLALSALCQIRTDDGFIN